MTGRIITAEEASELRRRYARLHDVPTFEEADGLAFTVEQQAAQIAALRRIATDETPHLYDGLCPDRVEGPNVRDPECPACQALGMSA